MSDVWRPCMTLGDLKAAAKIKIASADAAWLIDERGNRYIDAISSWWVNIHGHNHPFLNEALIKQTSNFAHVMTANFTHEPMLELAARLLEKTKGEFYKVLFTSDGSSAVEAAIKMAYQYFVNNGEKRTLFASFENAYHGETIGTLSLGAKSIYSAAYDDILIKGVTLKTPKDQSDNATNEALQSVQETLSQHKNNVFAVILEPLTQCAGEMRMHSAKFVKGVRQITKELGIFLILDEIAVGFGRTGSFFAYEQANAAPDFLCLSKALGAGYLPIAATLTTKDVASAFKGGAQKAFLHSHSHTGNALACAVANAGLQLFDKMDYISSNKPKIELMSNRLNTLKRFKNVKDVRQTGMIAAVQVNANEPINIKVFNKAAKIGVFLRPIGSVIYAMPPYCVSDDELNTIFDAIEACLNILKA